MREAVPGLSLSRRSEDPVKITFTVEYEDCKQLALSCGAYAPCLRTQSLDAVIAKISESLRDKLQIAVGHDFRIFLQQLKEAEEGLAKIQSLTAESQLVQPKE